jgi:hypothetical protein
MVALAEDRVQRIQELVHKLEAIPDEDSRNTAHTLVQAILELHGSGLERMLEIVFESGESGQANIRRFAADPLVASLLVLHGLHPDDLNTRVLHVLNKLQGKAELVGVFEGSVRVRLTSSGCGLAESVKAAIWEAIPDASEVLVEEMPPASVFVSLASLGLATPGSV